MAAFRAGIGMIEIAQARITQAGRKYLSRGAEGHAADG
jgi:hypothetical protein